MQVNPKIGLTFANGLRSFLRQDPDVIMVGEIRDRETAEIAIQASLTGHLVFSTLHTNDAAGAVTRLVDMGVEPFLVASSLVGVLAQRLVRLQECRARDHDRRRGAERDGRGPALMPVFEYKALDQRGKTVEGLKEADSPKTLRQVLRRDSLFLTEVLGQKEAAAAAQRDVSVRRWVGGRIGADDIAVTTRQLAVLVGAGVPLVEALGALVDQVDHERMKRIISEVRQRVNEGSSLADALAAHGKVFSTLYINMIRAGESSGALEIVLVRLADFTESQARLRSKVIGTLTYPAAMLLIGTTIMFILFSVVIPKITKIFEDTKMACPGPPAP